MMRRRLHILLFLLITAGCLPAQFPRAPRSGSTTPSTPWMYSDLLTLAPAGSQSPSHDLIAAYSRQAGPDLQFRLDLLDLDYTPDSDLYLALDTLPGGTTRLPIQAEAGLEWDWLLVLPASGRPYALTSQRGSSDSPAASSDPDSAPPFYPSQKIIPRLSRIPWQDALVISINAASLPEASYGFRLQAFITSAQGQVPEDSLGPIHSDNLPPGRAPIILAFWNTFPAYTPAQAIRRWDGAHTGPLGERHGLSLLLRAVRRTRLPVVLLDLKNPASLSALDFLGRLPEIQEMFAQGLLVLPDALPGSPDLAPSAAALPEWMLERLLAENRAIAAGFGLRASPILYSPSQYLVQYGPAVRQSGLSEQAFLHPYAVIFTPLESNQPLEWKGRTLVPLPVSSPVDQATVEGLPVTLRRTLLENALGATHSEPGLVLLGGDLVNSTWGDPQASEASLGWIAGHPWIQAVTGPDLRSGLSAFSIPGQPDAGSVFSISQPARGYIPGTSTHLTDTRPFLTGLIEWQPVALFSTMGQASPLFGMMTELLARLDKAPTHHGNLTQAAWQAYQSLFAPLPPESIDLAELRSLSGISVSALFEAVHWASDPGPHADCHADPDLDGIANCILASERFFSIFDSHGGRMLLLVESSPDGLHQIVAPSTQFIVGLGDPSSWDLSAGALADPANLSGGFYEAGAERMIYIPSFQPSSLQFTSIDGQVTKTFQFSESGLRVDYETARPVSVQVPLALDPWERFTFSWGERYRQVSVPGGWGWELVSGPRVSIKTSAQLDAFSFTATRPDLRYPEDPNLAYPRGHYLPFPLTLVEISGEGQFNIDLEVAKRGN